jgi:hypothetical protein
MLEFGMPILLEVAIFVLVIKNLNTFDIFKYYLFHSRTIRSKPKVPYDYYID